MNALEIKRGQQVIWKDTQSTKSGVFKVIATGLEDMNPEMIETLTDQQLEDFSINIQNEDKVNYYAPAHELYLNNTVLFPTPPDLPTGTQIIQGRIVE